MAAVEAGIKTFPIADVRGYTKFTSFVGGRRSRVCS
jgi:hypothetical protein